MDASFLGCLVGVTRQHITRLCRSGKIPGAYQSKGGHWRFRWSSELSQWANIECDRRIFDARRALISRDKLYKESFTLYRLQDIIAKRHAEVRRRLYMKRDDQV